MDRTASAGVEPGEEIPAELPVRRPSAREPEAGGDKPLTWFGGPKPSDSGSISTPGFSSPAVSAPRASGEPVSAPPEFGPASPAGPGRVSFGFSDGPIGGARPSRTRDGDEADDLPQRQRTENGPPETGELPRRPRSGSESSDTGDLSRHPRSDNTLSDTGDLSRRPRSDSDPAGAGNLSSRRRGSGSGSDELPIVRKSGNGTDEPAAFPMGPDPFSAGTGARPGNAAWTETLEAGPAGGPLAGLATPLWPDSGDLAGPRVSGNEWERLDEPVVWADTPAMGAAPTGSAASAVPATRPRRSRLVTAGMAVLGVVALAVIALTGVVYYTGDDSQISAVLGGGGKEKSRIVSGPLEDRSLATFELLAATDRVQLRIADLGEDLYRISSPEGSGIRPSADVRDDRLRVDVTRDNAGTGGEVEVLLAAKVRWTIRFSGYSAERIVDLSAGRIKGIELVGGTRRAELTLAQAAGTVPMKITGGIEELTLRAPAGSPVRIKVGGGAGTVTAGSRTLRDVAPGSTLTPKDWTTGNRYDIDAVAPVTLLTVETA